MYVFIVIKHKAYHHANGYTGKHWTILLMGVLFNLINLNHHSLNQAVSKDRQRLLMMNIAFIWASHLIF